MDYLLKLVALFVTALALAIHLLTRAKKSCPANLPPGSLGLPVIGQTLDVLRALRSNTLERWIWERIDRYGPVFKASVLCKPTVLLTGPAANKFMFSSSMLRVSSPRSFQIFFGEKNALHLHGEDHRRIRGALMEFLKPEMLKLYIGRIDAEVRHHLEDNWYGHTTITVLPLMKQLTFDVISALLFGIERGAVRDTLADDMGRMSEGAVAIPVNLPFTLFGRSLKASRRARRLLEGIMRENKAKLAQGKVLPNRDLITRLLSLKDDHGEQLLTNEEIIDNSMFVMFAGHDSTSILLACMLRHLANHPSILAAMVQEHDEIARNKADGEALTWEDLAKMKFTWQVAQETLRIDPPISGNFRKAVEDIEIDGYCIPKGWQVFWMANVTHMDPNIFHEPAKFDPSRFESKSSMVPPFSFIPFGGGPKLCPGVEFSRIETLVTMHNLVRQFSWKLCCKENTFVLDPLDGLQIELDHKISL